MDSIKLLDFIDEVYNYAEYLGLDEYVLYYNAEQVARTYFSAIKSGMEANLSYRMVALILFACTIEKIQNNGERIH